MFANVEHKALAEGKREGIVVVVLNKSACEALSGTTSSEQCFCEYDKIRPSRLNQFTQRSREPPYLAQTSDMAILC